MYPTSELYKSLMMRPDREFLCKVDVGDEEYGMGNIVDFLVETNLLAGEGFEIGTAFRSRLILRLKLKGTVPNNAKIVPYTSFDSSVMTWEQATIPWDEADISWGGGAGDWLPLGEFYINSRQKVNDVWEFECYCKLIFSEQPYVSALTYPATMQAVWDEICAQLSYTYDDTVVIDPSYTVPYKPVGMTCNEVMGYIAGANSASVRTGKDGRIQFTRYSAAYTPVMDMTAADYMRVAHTNPIKTYTRFVVTYDDEQDLAYAAGSGGEDQTLYYYNPFMTQQMVDDLEETLGGFIYQPIEMDARGYPPLDAGDWIGYEVYEGNSWDNTFTPWQDTHIPWNGMIRYGSILFSIQLGYRGGFKMLLDAPSKSPQQSEFVVPGQMEKKVDKINKESVKQGRNYYGVEISREEGLVVEVEGGGGKAVLNADELTFYKGSQKALYFDIPNDRYTFEGHLQAASGTFSGTVSAASVIGSTITGGTINGTTISGTNIYGSYIATGLGVYPFIELSSTARMLAAYGAADRYIRMVANPNTQGAPFLTFGFGGIETELAQLPGFFAINAKSGSQINMTASRIVVGAPMNYQAAPYDLGSIGPLNSTATTVTGIVNDFNLLLLYLRNMKIIS